MQEIHSIAGGSRLFGGGGGGDRRLRPHLHHQALKCPRCDSLNTKFCYYNNYNLSQPRHFCKGCRRYWTKGGVLRNVPVGGGCRKTKRSSKSKPTSETHLKSTSHSSSDSSSLTATAATAAIDAVSAPTTAPAEPISDGGFFSEIGSFTSLITSSDETLPFGFGNIAADETPFAMTHQFQANQWAPQRLMDVSDELKMQEVTGGGYVDQTAHVDPSGNCRSSNVGFGPLDWQSNGDHQALFDLPSAVDQAYWSQHQWTDQNQPNLYLP